MKLYSRLYFFGVANFGDEREVANLAKMLNAKNSRYIVHYDFVFVDNCAKG